MTKFERTVPININKNTNEKQKTTTQTLELHAQLHYGTREYFDFYNNNNKMDSSFAHDHVLYELLIDESLLRTTELGGSRYPRVLAKRPDGGPVLMASPQDRSTAQAYGLSCQVDVMDYTQRGWLHADYTRQEFLDIQQQQQQKGKAKSGSNNNNSNDTPLWALASTAVPGMETLSALFRPSTPSTPLQTPVPRRLFSNLFLPGNGLAAFLRSLLWLSLPSPELSVMVLDWSSILPRPTGGLSAVALPVLGCLVTGRILPARQLVFAQTVVNSETAGGTDPLLVLQRNDNAVQVLEQTLEGTTSSVHRVALLYGAMHCTDLTKRLRTLGFVPKGPQQWRTAWSVSIPSFGMQTKNGDDNAMTVPPEAIAVGLVILPLYLAVGGVDWIATLHDTAQSIEHGAYADAVLEVSLYLFRHVLLYVGLARFVVDWDGGKNTMNAGSRRSGGGGRR